MNGYGWRCALEGCQIDHVVVSVVAFIAARRTYKIDDEGLTAPSTIESVPGEPERILRVSCPECTGYAAYFGPCYICSKPTEYDRNLMPNGNQSPCVDCYGEMLK